MSNLRRNCVASINDETFKLPRLALDRLKAVFLVPSGLVEKKVLAVFGHFRGPI